MTFDKWAADMAKHIAEKRTGEDNVDAREADTAAVRRLERSLMDALAGPSKDDLYVNGYKIVSFFPLRIELAPGQEPPRLWSDEGIREFRQRLTEVDRNGKAT